jgi:DNA-directed RNA polymerase subunit F
MCAYYEDQTTKIKKEDIATYKDELIEILFVKHIKSNKTMDIEYKSNDEIKSFNIPYHAFVEGLVLEKRAEHA